MGGGAEDFPHVPQEEGGDNPQAPAGDEFEEDVQ